MKPMVKALLYGGLAMIGLIAVIVLASGAWLRWQYHLPSDQVAREQFANHRADYVRFAALLQRDPGAKLIDINGNVDPSDGGSRRHVPDYRDLIQRIGAKSVYVRRDGSVEFELWGFGCAPCTDSYKGVRFAPNGAPAKYPYGGAPKITRSLEDKNLPREKDAVADGLYVLPLDGEWSIYRLQISD
jgi:hypothetical protein